MRRLLTFALLLSTLSAVLVALPTLTPAGADPRPVPASVHRIPLQAVVGAARAGALRTDTHATKPFSLMGVTWAPDPAVDEVQVQVRHRSNGRWSDWETVQAHTEDAPDAGSVDTRSPGYRMGTAPIWTGPSDGVQVRLEVLSGATPRDVSIELVDPGTSPADAALSAPRGSAHAEAPTPRIITRQEWGADESIRKGSPSYNATVRVGFVHHTASSNSYTAEQAAQMVRGIYAYHVKSNGWSDIGYNYLVDRYGRAYEGRAGGLDRFVVGAHTGGFNKDSFGVSLLGDFSTVAPSTATVGMLTDVLAWKLGSAYRDPLAKAVLTSAGGGTSKYAAGAKATFDVVSGHRDAGNTACPGATTYARMVGIRAAVGAKVGAGFVDPLLSGSGEHKQGARDTVAVSARTRGPLSWTTTVEDSSGGLLRSATGLNADGSAVSVSWDLTDATGRPVKPGRYYLRMNGVRDGDRARPLVREIVVQARVCRGGPLDRAKCKAGKRD